MAKCKDKNEKKAQEEKKGKGHWEKTKGTNCVCIKTTYNCLYIYTDVYIYI